MTETTTIGDRELPCMRCGYDLRGHDQSGRCSECGLTAYWSIRAPANLSQYPAAWVTAMSRAVRLLMGAYAIAFMLILAGAGDWLPNTRMMDAIAFTILFLAAIMQLIGAWLISTRSGHYTEPHDRIVRFVLRVSSIGPMIAGPLGVWLYSHYAPNVTAVCIVCAWAGVVTPFAAFLRLRSVARMIAEPSLAEHSAIVGYGFLVTLLAIVPLLALAAMMERFLGQWSIVFLLPIAASLLLFLLWGAFLMFCCVIDFGMAARIAREEWKANVSAV